VTGTDAPAAGTFRADHRLDYDSSLVSGVMMYTAGRDLYLQAYATGANQHCYTRIGMGCSRGLQAAH
jgi:hypothetical protein